MPDWLAYGPLVALVPLVWVGGVVLLLRIVLGWLGKMGDR
jgi:hypothetical protein